MQDYDTEHEGDESEEEDEEDEEGDEGKEFSSNYADIIKVKKGGGILFLLLRRRRDVEIRRNSRKLASFKSSPNRFFLN